MAEDEHPLARQLTTASGKLVHMACHAVKNNLGNFHLEHRF